MDGCLPSAHFSELESLLQQKNYRQRGVSKQLFIIFRHRWTITKLLISRKFGWSFLYRILQRHQWDLDIFSCYTFFLEKPQGKFILQLHVFASTVNLFCNYMSLPALNGFGVSFFQDFTMNGSVRAGDFVSPVKKSTNKIFFLISLMASGVSSNVEHETTLYSHHRPCDWQDI